MTFRALLKLATVAGSRTISVRRAVTIGDAGSADAGTAVVTHRAQVGVIVRRLALEVHAGVVSAGIAVAAMFVGRTLARVGRDGIVETSVSAAGVGGAHVVIVAEVWRQARGTLVWIANETRVEW